MEMNYQLRWLERKTGQRGMNEHGYYYDVTERVLQSRQRIRMTDYSVVEQPDMNRGSIWIWSEWSDIPTVSG